jgi:hypothetical protein
MEYHEHFASKKIWFDVKETDPELLDKLAFVLLVSMKVDAEITHVSNFWRGKKRDINVRLLFQLGRLLQRQSALLSQSDGKGKRSRRLSRRAGLCESATDDGRVS